MSLQSWKEEFYPVDASDCPKEDAIEHSLLKWVGLRRENRGRHDVGLDGFNGVIEQSLKSGDRLGIDSVSCALCVVHLDRSCGDCPLFLVRGQQCDHRTQDEEASGLSSPWTAWAVGRDPEPMIFWLIKAKEQVE